MNRSISRTLRSISFLLAFLLTVHQFAHAAKPPRRMLAALQQQAPIERQAPREDTTSSPEAVAQARLMSAKNIYVVDDGGDDAFPVAPGIAVERFTAALRSWGRYNIVSSINDADLVFQLRTAVTTTVVDGTTDSPSATVYHNPFFRLTIADPATLQALWPITVPVQTGTRRKDKADLFDISADNLVSRVKLLAGETLTPQETAQLRQSDHYGHRSKLAFVLVGVLVGAAVGGGFLMKHKFDEAVKKQNADLCKQNAFFCTVP